MGTRPVTGGNGPLTIPAIAGCCGGFVLIGALQALYGPAIPAFRTRFGVSPSVAGLALSAEFTGALAGIVIYHLMRPLAGDRRLLVTCYAVMALGASLFAISPQWPMALAASLITGFGSGGIDYGLNRLFATGFGRRSAAMLNLLNAHFGVGAVIGPVLIGAVGAARFPWLFGGVAAASLLLIPTLRGVRPDPALPGRPGSPGQAPGRGPGRGPGIRTVPRGSAARERPGVIEAGPEEPGAAAPSAPPPGTEYGVDYGREYGVESYTAQLRAEYSVPPEPEEDAGPAEGEPPATRGRTGLIVTAFVAIYVLYVAIESGVGGWEPTHLEAVGYSASVAATSTSGFWLALTIGRFAAVPVTLRWPGPAIVTLCCLGMAVFLLLAAIPAAAPWAYAGLGLCCAPIWATGLPWLARAAPKVAAASAYVMAFSMVGGIVFPPLLGRAIEIAGVRSVPLILCTLAVACTALSAWLRRATRTSSG
jgi:MFS transporter, FHS family, glucose/mannose:H+ symporter